MGRLSSWPALVAFSLAFSASATSMAQDLPYVNYLVGERALGLGGAFVGLADDPSATFHNPAGLALLPRTSISTSFWLVAWRRMQLQSGWQVPEGASDLRDDEISSPPLVVTAVARLGRPDAEGNKRHAVGMAIIKPLRLRYRFAAVLGGEGGPSIAGNLATIDVVHRDQARWYGLSYAYAPRARKLAIGASGFLALRSLVHEEIELHGESGVPQPSPAGYQIARHSLFSASTWHLVWRLGAVYTPAPRWRLGAMIQAPGIAVRRTARNRETTYDTDAAGEALIRNVEHDGLVPRRPIPWELRLGASWFPGPRSLVTADISLHGGAGRRDAPLRLVDEAVPRPRFLVMESHRAPSVRAALGAEIVLGRRTPVRGGLLWYRSGLPDVPASSPTLSPNDMNTVGASLGVGIVLAGGHEVSLGAACIHSSGMGSALDQSVPDDPVYRATLAQETRVLLFLGGGRRAAKRLARKLAKESERWLTR